MGPGVVGMRADLEARAQCMANIRQFFSQRGVVEVSTPVLSQAATTDVHIDSFVCRAMAQPHLPALYMHTSPELAMKQLLIAGSGDIFQMCPVGRGGESGPWHMPTFTMLEWYRLGFTLDDLIDETVALVQVLMPEPMVVERQSYQQIYQQCLGVDQVHALSTDALRQLVHAHGAAVAGLTLDRSTCFDLLMTQCIEPQLRAKPCVVIEDYPSCQAALAQVVTNAQGVQVANRAELYLWGIECGNGFVELTDPIEQRQRFESDQRQRAQLGLPLHPMDEGFLQAMAQGLPACAGMAMGVDRLWALVRGQDQLN